MNDLSTVSGIWQILFSAHILSCVTREEIYVLKNTNLQKYLQSTSNIHVCFILCISYN